MREIKHACKINCEGELNLSYIFDLVRSCKCLNPHNMSYEEFKEILVCGVEGSTNS